MYAARFLALRLPIALLALCLCASVASAEKVKGTVKLRDGRTFENVLYEVRGSKVWVKRKHGPVTYRLSQVKDLIPAKPEGPSVEGGDELGVDWSARFRLTAPKGWKLVKPNLPLVRAQLVHNSRKANMLVRVRPAGKTWRFGRDEKSSVGKLISEELGTFFAKCSARPDIGSLHGAPVYRISDAKATPYGASKGGKLILHEVRFQRFGMEYALTITIGEDDAGALEQALDPVFASFSFLPTLQVDKAVYSDHARSFTLKLPLDSWTMRAAPFDNDRPLTLRNGDGRVSVDVEIAAGKDVEQLVRARLDQRKRKSKGMKKEQVQHERISGTEVIRFSFEDFRSGETKLRRFNGFAAQAGGNMVFLIGQLPVSDLDADKLARELEALYQTVRVGNPRGLAAEARTASSAWELIAQGNEHLTKDRHGEAAQRFNEAIEALPGFALAHFLRALARKGKGEFAGYKEDLEEAVRLDPNGGFGVGLGGVAKDEAIAALKSKNYATALTLWARVYSSEASADNLKNLVLATTKLWQEMKKSGEYNGYKTIDRELKKQYAEGKIAEEVFKICIQASESWLRKKKYSAARKPLRTAKKLLRPLKRHKDYKKFKKKVDVTKANIEKAEKR
jgi:tetratricopeptide (TPR) repeat protein